MTLAAPFFPSLFPYKPYWFQTAIPRILRTFPFLDTFVPNYSLTSILKEKPMVSNLQLFIDETERISQIQVWFIHHPFDHPNRLPKFAPNGLEHLHVLDIVRNTKTWKPNWPLVIFGDETHLSRELITWERSKSRPYRDEVTSSRLVNDTTLSDCHAPNSRSRVYRHEARIWRRDPFQDRSL